MTSNSPALLIRSVFLVFIAGVILEPCYAEDSQQQTENDSGQDVPVYISKSILPSPPGYLVSASDEELQKVNKGTCGNKTVDPGEECDDGNLESGDGCSSDCTVEKKKEDLKVEGQCGNGVLDQGEQCDGAAGRCAFGLVCNGECHCGPRVIGICGNGRVDPGEQCGEPQLSNCAPGLRCELCRCVLDDSINCGYMSCPNDSRCRIQYCNNSDGSCVFGTPELVGGLSQIQYGSGELDVAECCARVRYELYVSFNPCTGEIDPSTYEVRLGGISRTNEERCYCAIREPDGTFQNPDGQTVDCHDAIDRSASVQVSPVSGSEPRLQISCSNCCGDQISTERTLETAGSQPPVNCGQTNCPAPPGHDRSDANELP